MGVAPIHENQLAGSMAGFFGKKKGHCVGDLFSSCHSISQWNPRNDILELFIRIVKGTYPSFILRGHRLGHDHGIHPDGRGRIWLLRSLWR